MKNSHRSISVRSGFTLVELLVVITIIALLAVLTIPGIQHAQELARRAKCKSNLQNIAKACIIYMNTDQWHRNSSIGKGLPRKESGPTAANWSSGVSGNPASLWLLVSFKLVGRDSFLCPSALINRDFRTPPADANVFASNTLSYSYLSQVAFDDNTSAAAGHGATNVEITSSSNGGLRASELAIIADANPRCRVGQQSFTSQEEGKNSWNHMRAGQNVAFMTGNADWFTTTTIPGTNPLSNNVMDDIYQPAGSADGTQGKRGAINDAFLIP
ncbi:MAG: prepilin-type N-terminal cleavage/methylation domain-containing protein [Phycisphaerae bacterium]|nr:prepilin-type N-terminal cleavage/methylation domain-containing protein [Phycisphaerae bacterium]